MAIELATAYFSFLPSMAGTAAAAAPGLRALEGQAAASGARSGALMGGALAGGIGKFIPIIGTALAGIGIADFFGNAIDAASDLNESGNAVRVTFGDAAKEIEKLGGDSATRLGLTATDFNAAAVRLSSFAEGLAGGGRSVADVIDELTTRGADFASVYNIDVADALAIFQSGLSGEAEPLKRFGINLLDSEVRAYAYANGIAAVGAELTESEKLQARYGLLLQATSKVQGDFANTSDQLANQQRINSALLQQSLAEIGTALLPAATAFAQFIGSPENQARLQDVVDLLVKAGPAVEVVEEFRRLHPAVDFRLDVAASGQLLDRLSRGALDLVIHVAAQVPGHGLAPKLVGGFVLVWVHAAASALSNVVPLPPDPKTSPMNASAMHSGTSSLRRASASRCAMASTSRMSRVGISRNRSRSSMASRTACSTFCPNRRSCP